METTRSASTHSSLPALKNDLLLRVLHHLPVSRVPVWMMRQAGRTDPQYRALREKDGRSLEALFRDPERSIEISLLPKRLGVDAIIMFQDILTPLTPMGAEFRFVPGPVLESPIQTLSQIQALQVLDPARDLDCVGQLIRGLRRQLGDELPLLGFAGSPMTLAFFMITGKSPGADYTTIYRFIEEQPQTLQALLDVLTPMTIDYLNYQIECGVHAVQLFESFGDVIPRPIYEQFVQPTHQRIFAGLNPQAASILFVKECNFLDLMLQSGASVLSVGHCVDLKETISQAPESMIFQGNVNNQILFESPETITQAVRQCFEQTGKRNHILNLNHGLLAQTPFEHVQHFVNVAKELGKIENGD